MGEGLRAPNDLPPPSPHATAMRSQMFSKIGVLKNFAIFTRKHLCWKRRLQHRCFSVNIAKFLRTVFFKEHVWWLLLNTLMEKTNVILFDHTNKFINVFLSILQQKNITKGIFLFEIIYAS